MVELEPMKKDAYRDKKYWSPKKLADTRRQLREEQLHRQKYGNTKGDPLSRPLYDWPDEAIARHIDWINEVLYDRERGRA